MSTPVFTYFYNSMFVTVCYFKAVDIFSLEPDGTRGERKALRPYNMCFSVLRKPDYIFTVKNSFENFTKSWGRWSEMEFLNGFFSQGYLAYTWVLSNSSFCLVFYPHFSFLQNAIHEYTRVFKTRVWEYGFFKNPPIERTVSSMKQKTWVFHQTNVQEFHLRQCFGISITGHSFTLLISYVQLSNITGKQDPHCYKTFRRIPPPSPDDARLILLYRGKWLLHIVRKFAPSATEVFCR